MLVSRSDITHKTIHNPAHINEPKKNSTESLRSTVGPLFEQAHDKHKIEDIADSCIIDLSADLEESGQIVKQAMAVQNAAQQNVFNFSKFDQELGLPQIRNDFEDLTSLFANDYEANSKVNAPWYNKAAQWFVNKLTVEERTFNSEIEHRVKTHANLNAEFARKFEILQDRWSTFTQFIGGQEGKLNSNEIYQKHAELTQAYYHLYGNFLSEQIKFLQSYSEVLKSISPFADTFNEARISRLQKQIDDAKAQLMLKGNELNTQYNDFKKQHQEKTENGGQKIYQQLYDLVVLSSNFSKNPKEVIEKLISNITTLSRYAKSHPSKIARRALNNLSMVYHQLNDSPTNFKMLRLQLEKSFVIDAFLPEHVLSEKEEANLPENIQQICNTLEILPRLIATFQGMRGGSFMPLQQMGLFADALNLPLAWVFPLVDVVFGGYVGYKAAALIQDAPEMMTEQEKTKVVSFFKILEKKFATMEELQEEQNIVSAYAFVNSLDKMETIRTDIFKRLCENFKDFTLKMKYAGRRERTVRLIGQVAVPALILTAMTIGVIAASVAITPVGVVLVATIIASIGAMAQGAYTAYQTTTTLSRWIDEHYDETVVKVENHKKDAQKQLNDKQASGNLEKFLDDNKTTINKMIADTQENFIARVNHGRYDKFLRFHKFKDKFVNINPEQRPQAFNNLLESCRRELIKEEKEIIAMRLKGAAFFKTCGLSKETVEVFKKNTINANEHLEEIKKIMNPENSWMSKEVEEIVIQNGMAQTKTEEAELVKTIMEGFDESKIQQKIAAIPTT